MSAGVCARVRAPAAARSGMPQARPAAPGCHPHGPEARSREVRDPRRAARPRTSRGAPYAPHPDHRDRDGDRRRRRARRGLRELEQLERGRRHHHAEAATTAAPAPRAPPATRRARGDHRPRDRAKVAVGDGQAQRVLAGGDAGLAAGRQGHLRRHQRRHDAPRDGRRPGARRRGGAQAARRDGQRGRQPRARSPICEPGKTGRLTVTLPAGKYVLLCNLPGHFAGGMYADFTVELTRARAAVNLSALLLDERLARRGERPARARARATSGASASSPGAPA